MLVDPRRRQLATFAALLWAFGFELGPLLHVARHAELEPHEHGAAAHVHGHSHGHAHDHAPAHGHVHENESDAHALGEGEPEKAPKDAKAWIDSRAPVPHGAHSLEHRGLAVLTPPPATPRVAEAAACEAAVLRSLRSGRRDRARYVAQARGPPAARLSGSASPMLRQAA